MDNAPPNIEIFDRFINSKYGLRGFQPTILWRTSIVFPRSVDQGTFVNENPKAHEFYTDSIVVPGESLNVESLDNNYWGDIQFPVPDKRTTTNNLQIGVYVDIYSTIENLIKPWMDAIEINGIKNTISLGNSLYYGQVHLYRYRMRGDHPCDLHYHFKNVFPISYDSYTYDQKNMSWANVRNVTFAFSDYTIEIDKSIDSSIDGSSSRSDNDNLTFDETDFAFGASMKYPIVTPNTFTGFLKDDASRITDDHRSIKNRDIDEILGNDVPFVEPKEIKTPDAFKNLDTPKQEKDNLITTIIKTAVKKLLIPDTPMYHTGSGNTWTPGVIQNLGATIRKVQEIFYTEPKIKKPNADDVVLYNGAGGLTGGAKMIDASQDDTISELNHGNPNLVDVDPNDYMSTHLDDDSHLVEIDPNDHTMEHLHTNGSVVDVDPDDYTHDLSHGDPSVVNPDENDYTTLNSHGNPNEVPVDPNDYTTMESHGNPNEVPVDPNDYTTENSHGNPNDVAIDQNDFTTQNSHGTPNSVSIDKNDYPTMNSLSDNSIPLDKNDFASSTNLNYDAVALDQNDTPESTGIRPNLKSIDKNDAADSETLSANTVSIPANDYSVPSNNSIKRVAIDENDHVLDHSDSGGAGSGYKRRVLMPNDEENEFEPETEKKTNRIPTSSDDTPLMDFIQKSVLMKNPNVEDHILNHSGSEDGAIPVDRDDTPRGFNPKNENHVSISGNDSIHGHGQTIGILGNPIDDVPNVDRLPVGISKIDSSDNLVDSSGIKTREIRPDKNDFASDKLTVNIVRRPEEREAIDTWQDFVARIVDVHKNDHTQIK